MDFMDDERRSRFFGPMGGFSGQLPETQIELARLYVERDRLAQEEAEADAEISEAEKLIAEAQAARLKSTPSARR